MKKIRESVFRFLANNTYNLVLLLFYTSVVIAVSFFHELWRDEVCALSISISSKTVSSFLTTFFNPVRTEGHPFLWYLVLKIGYFIWPSVYILPVISMGFAIGAAAVFVFCAPFNKFLKALFLFGALPVYQYSVVCRNYGMMMLFLICLYALYEKRFQKALQFSLVIVLLANSHFCATIVAFAFFVSYIYECICEKRWNVSIYFSIAIMIFGFLLIIFQFPWGVVFQRFLLADFSYGKYDFFKILIEGVKAVALPGFNFQKIFFFENSFFTTFWIPLFCMVIAYSCFHFKKRSQKKEFFLYGLMSITGVISFLSLSMYRYFFLKRKNLFIIAFISITGLSVLFSFFWEGDFRHEAILLLLFVGMYWIVYPTLERKVVFPLVTAVMAALLLVHFFVGIYLIYQEINKPYSSAKSFARYLQKTYRNEEVIILGEPCFYMEALPYYLNYSNQYQLYFPRDNKFSLYSNFSNNESDKIITIKELMENANFLKKKYHKRVLLFFDPDLLSSEGADQPEIRVAYSFLFKPLAQEKTLLFETYQKVYDVDNSIMNEDFTVFLVE